MFFEYIPTDVFFYTKIGANLNFSVNYTGFLNLFYISSFNGDNNSYFLWTDWLQAAYCQVIVGFHYKPFIYIGFIFFFYLFYMLFLFTVDFILNYVLFLIIFLFSLIFYSNIFNWLYKAFLPWLKEFFLPAAWRFVRNSLFILYDLFLIFNLHFYERLFVKNIFKFDPELKMKFFNKLIAQYHTLKYLSIILYLRWNFGYIFYRGGFYPNSKKIYNFWNSISFPFIKDLVLNPYIPFDVKLMNVEYVLINIHFFFSFVYLLLKKFYIKFCNFVYVICMLFFSIFSFYPLRKFQLRDVSFYFHMIDFDKFFYNFSLKDYCEDSLIALYLEERNLNNFLYNLGFDILNQRVFYNIYIYGDIGNVFSYKFIVFILRLFLVFIYESMVDFRNNFFKRFWFEKFFYNLYLGVYVFEKYYFVIWKRKLAFYFLKFFWSFEKYLLSFSAFIWKYFLFYVKVSAVWLKNIILFSYRFSFFWLYRVIKLIFTSKLVWISLVFWIIFCNFNIFEWEKVCNYFWFSYILAFISFVYEIISEIYKLILSSYFFSFINNDNSWAINLVQNKVFFRVSILQDMSVYELAEHTIKTAFPGTIWKLWEGGWVSTAWVYDFLSFSEKHMYYREYINVLVSTWSERSMILWKLGDVVTKFKIFLVLKWELKYFIWSYVYKVDLFFNKYFSFLKIIFLIPRNLFIYIEPVYKILQVIFVNIIKSFFAVLLIPFLFLLKVLVLFTDEYFFYLFLKDLFFILMWFLNFGYFFILVICSFFSVSFLDIVMYCWTFCFDILNYLKNFFINIEFFFWDFVMALYNVFFKLIFGTLEFNESYRLSILRLYNQNFDSNILPLIQERWGVEGDLINYYMARTDRPNRFSLFPEALGAFVNSYFSLDNYLKFSYILNDGNSFIVYNFFFIYVFLIIMIRLLCLINTKCKIFFDEDRDLANVFNEWSKFRTFEIEKHNYFFFWWFSTMSNLKSFESHPHYKFGIFLDAWDDLIKINVNDIRKFNELKEVVGDYAGLDKNYSINYLPPMFLYFNLLFSRFTNLKMKSWKFFNLLKKKNFKKLQTKNLNKFVSNVYGNNVFSGNLYVTQNAFISEFFDNYYKYFSIFNFLNFYRINSKNFYFSHNLEKYALPKNYFSLNRYYGWMFDKDERVSELNDFMVYMNRELENNVFFLKNIREYLRMFASYKSLNRDINRAVFTFQLEEFMLHRDLYEKENRGGWLYTRVVGNFFNIFHNNFFNAFFANPDHELIKIATLNKYFNWLNNIGLKYWKNIITFDYFKGSTKYFEFSSPKTFNYLLRYENFISNPERGSFVDPWLKASLNNYFFKKYDGMFLKVENSEVVRRNVVLNQSGLFVFHSAFSFFCFEFFFFFYIIMLFYWTLNLVHPFIIFMNWWRILAFILYTFYINYLVLFIDPYWIWYLDQVRFFMRSLDMTAWVTQFAGFISEVRELELLRNWALPLLYMDSLQIFNIDYKVFIFLLESLKEFTKIQVIYKITFIQFNIYDFFLILLVLFIVNLFVILFYLILKWRSKFIVTLKWSI